MSIVSLKFDRRYKNANGESPIVFFVNHKRQKCSIPTGIYVMEKHVNGEPNKMLKSSLCNASEVNSELYSLYLKYNKKLQELTESGRASLLSAKEIKRALLFCPMVCTDSFTDYAQRHICKYSGATLSNYKRTLSLVDKFFGGTKVFFDDITAGVLRDMDESWSKSMGVNARSIHFRNIRTIFNRAIDDEVYTKYPFRTFKIKTSAKEKDYLPVELFRKLQDLSFKKSEHTLEMCRDLFLLSFYFCGANLNDIFVWSRKNVSCGKLSFVRKKIAFREPDSINICIQPEAEKLLKKYKGTDGFLLKLNKQYGGNYENFLGYVTKRMGELGGRIGFPKLTFYYARYSWATYADRLGVDEKVISKSLGHTDKSVAGKYYITYDWSRTDEANRKVINYLHNNI